MSDFIYEKNISPSGIAVEEIYGADEKSPKVWKLFALQIFSEAEGDYRNIEHLDNGAPIFDGISQRISVSHTTHHLVVASIPKTPDINLEEVNIRTAIGVDIEKSDRLQVLKVIDKFLTAEEQKLLPSCPEAEGACRSLNEEDGSQIAVEYILAWTCKEALYKAVMGVASDWKEDYRIISLPKLAADIKSATPDKYGKAMINLPGAAPIEMNLASWQSDGHIITLAFSRKIPMFR